MQATDGFKYKLGRGSFGIIYNGVMHDDSRTLVAVKKLDRVAQDFEKEFRTEVNVIGQMVHSMLGPNSVHTTGGLATRGPHYWPKKKIVDCALIHCEGFVWPLWQSLRAKVSNALAKVTDLLSAANLSRLRESCFGHLVGVADIQFQGQVYHILLRNHLLVDNPNRLRFLIHDKVHEFGPAEFGLITGLKFSGDYDLPKSSDMYDVCFPNKRSLKFVDILAAFKQECEISGGDSELSLKLAFLFLLYGVVLMRDRNDTNIQMQFVHLADDIEKFNDYPWGRVSYEYLVKATLSRKEVLEKQLRQGKKAAYDAFGFLMALQVWAYEVIPDLASHCAHKIEGKEQVFPRILHWTAPEFFQYDYLMPFFLAEPVQPRGLLPPTEEELRHLQRLGLQQIHVSPPKLYPEVTLTEIGSSVKELLVRVGCIETVMRSCKCLVNVDAVAGAKPGPSVHLSDLQSPLPP
ncbi:hypothetical protein C2S52_017333 [Perilla frutescens var. hirtella]|nr:hypothetical protein C2S52_017333 [Perilla frutescens var. hirtella]